MKQNFPIIDQKKQKAKEKVFYSTKVIKQKKLRHWLKTFLFSHPGMSNLEIYSNLSKAAYVKLVLTFYFICLIVSADCYFMPQIFVCRHQLYSTFTHQDICAKDAIRHQFCLWILHFVPQFIWNFLESDQHWLCFTYFICDES